ncbi:MAG: flagellar filament capping protein FliD [Oscillospiraceae bacterium]|nr:flagellar filament capping protein FliD [Oscillospiraceae bacterium]
MASDIMRLSGINSGYDAESMIEKMMSTYQTKIDNQNKKLQKLQWKQEAYRDITSKLTAFKNKYFDILKRDSYLMSPTSFSKFKSTITNKANPDRTSGLKVSTTSNSVEGNYKLKVEQLATASTRTGKVLEPAGFSLDIDKAISSSEYTENASGGREYKFELDVKVGDVTKTIEFGATLNKNADGTFDNAAFKTDLLNKLNTEFSDAFGTSDGTNQFVKAKDNGNGTFGFETSGNAAVIVTEKTGNFGLSRPSEKIAIATQAAVTGTNSIAVNINGKVKNVEFEGVSENYFDSRNEAGNSAVLAEYNRLKTLAYIKDKGYPAGGVITQEMLDGFTYTSTQAAKDKNSEAISSALNSAYSSEGVRFTIDGSYITAKKGGENIEFSLTATSGGTLGLQKGTVTNRFSDKDRLSALGIAANADGKYEMTVNGKKISVDAKATISDLVKAVNNSDAGVTMTYSKMENKFVITANDLGNGGDVDISGSDSLAKSLGLVGEGSQYELGKNAKFMLNGIEVYHNSNSYTTDGTTFDFSEAELDTELTVGISKDYTDIKQSIKDFVKDYNQLIDDIYNYVGTAPKRDAKNNLYEPLTDAEKEEMDDKEIEKWETAAKAGVLYNDSTVSSIMSKMRIAIYGGVTLDDGSKFGLFNMGIKTISGLTDPEGAKHGKLEIDEDALDKAFAENPEAITKLFTDPESGVMKQINNVIDDAISTSKLSGNVVKGSLIRKAGLESGSTAKNNAIYREMEQINKRIATLQDRYDSKEEYWWSVFTNLEKAMSDLNSQSSYMSGFLNNFGTTQ